MIKKKNVAIAMAAVTMAGTVAPVVVSALEIKDSKDYTLENQDARSLVGKVRDLLEQKSDEKKKQDLYTIYTNVEIAPKGHEFAGKLINGQDTIIIDETVEGSHTKETITNVKKITNATDLANILELASNDESFKGTNKELEVVIINNGFVTVDNKKVTKIIPTYDNILDLDATRKNIEDTVESKKIENLPLDKELSEDRYKVSFNKKTGEIKVDIYNDIALDTGDSFEDIDAVNEYIKDEGITGVTTEEIIIPKVEESEIGDKGEKYVLVDGSSEVGERKVARLKSTIKVNKDDAKLKLTDNNVKFIVEGQNDAIELNSLFGNRDTKAGKEALIKRMGDISGFETQIAQDIESKELAKIRVTNSNIKELQLSKFFDGMMLTEEGVTLLNSLKTKDLDKDGVGVEVNFEVDEKVTEVTKNKEYKLGLTVTKTTTSEKSESIGLEKKIETFELTIKSDNKDNLDKLRKMLQSVADEPKFNVGVNAVQSARTLMGNTRFETAIEVSKELYPEGNAADAVVLVQKDAIVDGLAATPLAKTANAPILFTDTTSVPSKVVTEIKRALNIKGTAVGELEKKTIYVVGGTTVIDPAVEVQLKEIGVTVKRIDGINRMETSVNIAEEMKYVAKKKDAKFDSKAFVVGKNGEADAMSIAGYAAQNGSPIIVADTNGLTKTAADFIEDEMKTADIIGGDAVVKSEIKDELVELLGNKEANVERVEGLRRAETNANVINKYYKGKTSEFNTVFVAKNGQGKVSDLADSLVAGPLAADKKAPIVLATTDLSVEQSETLDLRLDGQESLVQVGGGVARTIVEKIAIKLGLVK